MIRTISLGLIGFAALCWIGAAYVGITNSGGPADTSSISVLNMFNGVAQSSALIAIALGLWLKD